MNTRIGAWVLTTCFLTSLMVTNVSIAEEQSSPVFQIGVTISNKLPTERFSQNWPVHVYLTSPGSKIPLSSKTTRLDKLPFKTTLTEKDNVLPMFTLKGHKELVLVVKISSSGDPHKTGSEDYRQVSPKFEISPNNKTSLSMTLSEQ